jgi:isopenicillin N synthase-like dioxygenase
MSTPGSRRMSIGYFLHPNYDAEIACLPTCSGSDQPLRYPPVRAGDMMRQKLEARGVMRQA